MWGLWGCKARRSRYNSDAAVQKGALRARGWGSRCAGREHGGLGGSAVTLRTTEREKTGTGQAGGGTQEMLAVPAGLGDFLASWVHEHEAASICPLLHPAGKAASRRPDSNPDN